MTQSKICGIGWTVLRLKIQEIKDYIDANWIIFQWSVLLFNKQYRRRKHKRIVNYWHLVIIMEATYNKVWNGGPISLRNNNYQPPLSLVRNQASQFLSVFNGFVFKYFQRTRVIWGSNISPR